MHRNYRIRERRPSDDAALVAVENRAAELFRAHGHPEISDAPIPDVAFIRAMMAGCDVWVAVDATDSPVGFAVAQPVAGWYHLKELSVDPGHGRHGIGTELVSTVLSAANQRGFPAVSLTTYREVPFNAPFYRRLGFTELALADAPGPLVERFHDEVPDGSTSQSRVLLIGNS